MCDVHPDTFYTMCIDINWLLQQLKSESEQMKLFNVSNNSNNDKKSVKYNTIYINIFMVYTINT